jgi:glucan biosynthesis protein C
MRTAPDLAPGGAAASGPSRHVHYLDAMRSVLMILGILYHASMAFSTDADWLIKSPQAHPAFGVLASVLASFRIQAFFIVSGYFCLQTLTRYGPANFISLRGPRIAVPLIATAFTLNGAQEIVLARVHGLAPSVGHFFSSRTWISHLWFLFALLYYFLTAFVLALLLPARARHILRRGAAAIARIPAPVLLLALAAHAVLLLGGSRLFPVYERPLHFISYHTYLYYLPFFAFGMLLRQREDLLERFAAPPWTLYLAVVAVSHLVPGPAAGDALSLGSRAPLVYRDALITWLSCSLCFHLFRRCFDRPSALFAYLADASYSVYLFHHLLVICFGLLLFRLDWPGVPGFAILVGATLAACLAIHHFVIRPVPLLRFLYNGRAPGIDRRFRKPPERA